ncbi:hypothetical protein [Enterococcus gilvus]|uniref:Uncharacterized protein n=1 Tax=Enterococcus gilvus ATCC BAA-350 TaxID=1158614 RepID=R2V5U4_9ENTE|nr:hypothetical protein [Enterococcus gilvus]EOI53115.1 hypothetical protein UKC_04023 [Enterococcus gilvus ATCC BAA-350]EOW78434.1 hypothetical protein I592_04027 [Enterococcus gilvus ATCC BAA-350]OJG40423.1 hypothetical protein RV02_GL002372 [Enterococcus gilvus]
MILFVVSIALAFSIGLIVGVVLIALLSAGKYDDMQNNRIE